jgi:hypothetical protein
MGTLIRHEGLSLPASIGSLPIPVIEPAFRTELVTAVGCPKLRYPGVSATFNAAVTLAAVATGTDPEDGLAPRTAANPRSENDRIRGGHARSSLKRSPTISRLTSIDTPLRR